MRCVTSATSMPTGLMPTACQRGKSLIICAEEVVFLGNDLTTPDFWMYSFRAKNMLLMATKTAMCL
jgi:hypothetical protein